MLHNFELMAETVAYGVVAHLTIWEGWAVLIGAAFCSWRTAVWWIPIPVALIINPTLYQAFGSLVHGHQANVYSGAAFTLAQLLLAFGGFLLVRGVKRFR